MVNARAVKVLRPDDRAVVDGTADQAADCAVEAAGRVDEVLPGGVQRAAVRWVGQNSQRRTQRRAVSLVESAAGLLKLRGDHALSGPTVHKHDFLPGMPPQNQMDGVFIKTLAADDADAIMQKVAPQHTRGIAPHQYAARDTGPH